MSLIKVLTLNPMYCKYTCYRESALLVKIW